MSSYDFSKTEVIRNVRTKWRNTPNLKTTGNTGDIIPIYFKEILPGDYVSLYLKSLIKMTTPLFQTMDNIFCDFHFWFIPRRLTWNHWKNFQGEKSARNHEDEPQFSLPKTTAPVGGWEKGTIADYFGIPTYVENLPGIDSAYFRSYCLVWNFAYIDQNRQDFTDFSDGDENTVGSNGSNYVTDAIKGGKPLKAAKIHDYFTSTLLQPQAGDPVTLPLGISAPVIGTGYSLGLNNGEDGNANLLATFYDGTLRVANQVQDYTPIGTDKSNNTFRDLTNKSVGVSTDKATSGLTADLSDATAATVNQLRLAFALQKIYEANNRSGTRYVEILKSRWNVSPSDARLQNPEFLGGARVPINIDMVVQTSSTNEASPLGQISGFSNTFDERPYFSKGFEEHGILLGFAIVRHQRTYQQGLSKFFTRTIAEDFYMPEFQNIGEQPVYNREIFCSGDTAKDNEVFGYQEYGAEYRYEPNRVTGQFRSNAPNSFDTWHYADDYSETPVNNEDWIVENPDSVDRTLTVPHTESDQFYFDLGFNETIVRTMPPHSIPGFIDHH